MNQDWVYISSLSKSFNKKPALLDITTQFPKGKMIGVAGPDGAGKTTLIRLIAGLLAPTSGSITIGGQDTVKQAAAISSLIGYMPQKFGLYEDLTVLQNMNLYADLKGCIGLEREESFKRLFSFTNLEPFKDRLSGALSGGMKQKLGLSCALLKKPSLLLLDEPTVGVDPLSRRELWKIVETLLKEEITVIWSTCYLEEAEKCDHVLLLDEGRVIFEGNPSDLTKKTEGRTFKVKNIENPRLMLSKALVNSQVVDALVFGHDLRLVLKDPKAFEKSDIFEKIEPTKPRFEDAVIDILGGGPKEVSPLATYLPPIKEHKDNVIEALNLTKKFGSFTAVDQISFKVGTGEIFGLLGPNGAGKSTTFKMLCGLLHPTSGKALVNELDLEKSKGEARAQMGYMAQKFSLYGNLSVLQNLKFFSGAYNLHGKEQKKSIEEMIEIFNLKDFLNTPSEKLPLGFKQRLAMACSLMHRPKVLFLDEPTSGVDPITRREFWTHINGLVEKGVTIMVTTHFMDEAEYCDRIALIYQSKMITLGTPQQLKDKVRSETLPDPTLEEAFIELIIRHDSEKRSS